MSRLTLKEEAIRLHELYTSLKDAGFSHEDALSLTADALSTVLLEEEE